MKRTHYTLLLTLLVAACGSHKPATTADSRYQRKPLTEVTAGQLTHEAQVIDATTQQLIGNPAEALRLYRQAIASDPSDPAPYYQTGRLMLLTGRLDSALHYTLQATRRDADNVWYALQLAHIYDLRQDHKMLVATWEDIVKRHPKVLDHYYNLSNAYLKKGDIDGAIEALNRVERAYGVTEAVSLQKQRLWNAQGKADKAREEMERLAAAAPNDIRYNAILAEAYMQEKNYRKALQYYQQILTYNPDDENIHISMAQCCQLMGDLPAAYRHLRLGLANPAIGCRERVAYSGELLRDEKFYAAYSRPVFLLLDTLLADCPPTAGHAYGYGLMLASQERYAEAAVQFRNHLANDSSRYDAWESLMLCINHLPDSDTELLGLARRASRLFPLHVQPYYIQAVILHARGNYAEALRELQRCESVGFPRGQMQAESYYLTADCHNHLADTQRALAYYEKALNLRPDDPYLLNSYAYTLAETGRDLDRAADMARRALKSLPDDPNILDTYAWALFRQGRCAEALVQMRKAIANLKDDNPTLHQHLDTIQRQCQK